MEYLENFKEKRERYYYFKSELESVTQNLKLAKEEYKKSIEALSQWLDESMNELKDILQPTITTAIVEIMDKEPVEEPKFLSIGERYQEKYKSPLEIMADKINKKEKAIYEEKIKPRFEKLTNSDLKNLGITKEVLRNWMKRGTNPSKENFDKLVKYFGVI